MAGPTKSAACGSAGKTADSGREEFFRHEDPRGREYFWLTGAFVNNEPEAEDTDEWALSHGYVSVVPIQVDMTDYGQMENLRNILAPDTDN